MSRAQSGLWMRRVLFAGVLPVADPAWAHGFGERYSLPIPLWLYVTGAGLTVAVSFVMIALLARRTPIAHQPPGRMWLPIGRVRGARAVRIALQGLTVGLYLLVIIAGLFGTQSPLGNIAPAMVWAIWWVGMAYVSALLGNLWALINPLDTLFAVAESLYQRSRPGRRLSLGVHYPERFGVWPAVILFVVFIWMEVAWEASDHPASLAAAMLVYSALTWLGMLVFGRAEWLCRGEVFSLVFGLLARFAPIGSREAGTGGWALRPYGVGLLTSEPLPASQIALVLLLLASVSFDGFRDTPVWAAVIEWLDQDSQGWVAILGLTVLVSLFAGMYFAFCRLVVRWGTSRAHPHCPAASPSVVRIAGVFVLTLVPIAIAYNLAHYLYFIVMAAQYLIPLASDPFGLGWDLFGTRNYFVRSLIDARLVWHVSVAAIIVGHMAALYVAHLQALREFPDRRSAQHSQLPMLVLMAGYTILSLWMIAQPIVS